MLGLPESNLIVTLSQRSDRCVVLQYWHRDTGLLIKSMPLLGNMKGGWMLAVHPQTGDVAVVNGKKLRCWNFQTSKPLTSFPAYARGFDFLGEPWRLVRTLGSSNDSVVEVLDTRIPDYIKKSLVISKDVALKNARVTSSENGMVFAVSAPSMTRIYKRNGEGYSEVFAGTLATVGPHLALSRDGARLWTGAAVYDTATGSELCRMDRTGMEVPANVTGISDWVNAKTIVEIALLKADWPGAPEDAMERAMVLWDVETGKTLLHMDAPDANGLCISPDTRQICEAGNDMRLRLRNAQTLEVEREFRAHDGAVFDVEWHPKLPLLVSASDDLTVRVWNLKDGHLVEELHGIASQPDQRPERIAISADGRMLAVKGGTTPVALYELASAKPKTQDKGKKEHGPAGAVPASPAKGAVK
jgi:WD40 repeat protein